MASLYDVGRHGSIVVEYENIAPDGFTYALTDNGWCLRKGDRTGGFWATYHQFMPWALPDHVAAVRDSTHQRVTADHYTGHVPQPTRPREEGTVATKEKVDAPPEAPAAPEPDAQPEPVADAKPDPKSGTPPKKKAAAKPKESKPKAPKADKPLIMGARAGRQLDAMKLSKTRHAEVLAAAGDLARGRNDNRIRIWDVYEAAGEAVPEGFQKEKESFLATGKMPTRRSTDGQGKAEAGAGAPAAEEADTGTSPAPSPTPEASQPSTPAHNDEGSAPTASPTEPETEPSSDGSTTDDETL